MTKTTTTTTTLTATTPPAAAAVHVTSEALLARWHAYIPTPPAEVKAAAAAGADKRWAVVAVAGPTAQDDCEEVEEEEAGNVVFLPDHAAPAPRATEKGSDGVEEGGEEEGSDGARAGMFALLWLALAATSVALAGARLGRCLLHGPSDGDAPRRQGCGSPVRPWAVLAAVHGEEGRWE